jgi:DNA polymerase-3 subunit epsilon
LILLRAVKETGLDTAAWMKRCNGSATPGSDASIRREGDGDGPLVGETIVFTGSLQIPRRSAADMAHDAGAAVEPSVTKGTTLLVVGDQDLEKLNGQDKSSKHRKAEQLIEAGQNIRILCEADLMSICRE